MQLYLYSVRSGRGHSSTMDALVQAYLRRMQSPWRAEARVFRTEAALLEAVADLRRGGHTQVWLLDSMGKAMSSEQFAAAMQSARDSGCRHLVAAIGPADGWTAGSLASVRANAANGMLLSLGPMTLPHELARLVVAEQMYRATTILAGHPYHLGHE